MRGAFSSRTLTDIDLEAAVLKIMEDSEEESDTDSRTSVDENNISNEEDVTSIKEHYTQYTWKHYKELTV